MDSRLHPSSLRALPVSPARDDPPGRRTRAGTPACLCGGGHVAGRRPRSRGRDETIARALEAGADDYIVKPFSPTALTAPIRAVLRRRAAPVPFALGALALDYDQRRVTGAGRPVELTATAYELLRVLAQDAGRVLTRETLLRRVWAGRPDADPKIVRAYVTRLRDKLADAADRPALIVNERKVGYRRARPGRGGRALTARHPRPPAHRQPPLRNTQPTRATAVADQPVS